MLRVQNLAFCQTGNRGHSAVSLVNQDKNIKSELCWKRRKMVANVTKMTITFICMKTATQEPHVLKTVCQVSGNLGVIAL